jgi:signal transduction histidine kinase
MDLLKKGVSESDFGGDLRAAVQLKAVESERVVSLPAVRAAERDAGATTRDWSTTLHLVHETFSALQLSKERFETAENYSQELRMRYEEQLRAMEARAAIAESRAYKAEERARLAEDWLGRLHDAIVQGFEKASLNE